ncbi:MAG: glycosyltransferase family 9 protein [Deferrisomatales bacterium]
MKVLLVRLSSLGDVVLATAAVEALNRLLPRAEVHVATRAPYAELFRAHPGVGRVITWDPAAGVAGLARAVRRGRYARAVDLHGSLRTLALRWLCRATPWSRYRKGAVGRRLAVLSPAVARRLPPVSVVDRYLAALEPLGIRPRGVRPRLVPGPAAEARAEAWLTGKESRGLPWIALAPGARWPCKAWPAVHWAALAGEIRAAGLGVPVFVGGAGDRGLAARIRQAAGGVGVDLTGRISLLETAAVLGRCAAVVTNDSAPLHLAEAVGTPAVALFGPTVGGFGFSPLDPASVVLERDLPCRPCSLHGEKPCRRGDQGCLAAISAAEVRQALAGLVEGAAGARAPGRGAPWAP